MAERSLHDLEVDAFLAEAETLAQLTALPAWEAYATLLRDMRTSALEDLSHADASDFRYWQGVVATLAEILERPARVIATAATFTADEEQDKGAYRPELRAIVGMGIDSDGDV